MAGSHGQSHTWGQGPAYDAYFNDVLHRILSRIGTQEGECYYCRDGQHVTLVRYTRGAWHGADFVPDDEWVCQSCYNWLVTQ
jgi:hypothetical protein